MNLRIFLTTSFLLTWSSGSCITLSSKTADPIPPTEIEGLTENLAWIRQGDFKHQYRKKKNPIPSKYCQQTYKPNSKVCFEIISQGYLLGEAIPLAQFSSGKYSAKVEEEQSYSAVGEDLDETWPKYLLEYFPPEASTKSSTYSQQFSLQQRSYRKPRAFRPLLFSVTATMNSTTKAYGNPSVVFAQAEAFTTLRLPGGGIDGVFEY